MKQPQPDAVGRCAVNGETIRAGLAVRAGLALRAGVAVIVARFDAHAFVPGHGVADARLRSSRRDDGGFAKILRSFEQRIQSGSVDAIVIRDQKFHGNSNNCRGRLCPQPIAPSRIAQMLRETLPTRQSEDRSALPFHRRRQR